MTGLSGKIIREYLVRKTGKQKQAFRAALIAGLGEMGVRAREEKHKDLFGSVNVVAGDVEKAEIIFGAHYDTCPRMPVPNFITPKNKAVYYGYQMMIVCGLLLISIIPAALMRQFVPERGAYLIWYFTYLALFGLMMKGPANPTTMNDNTSGVVALVELMAKMPREMRERCAFVFFDNEEVGLMGSAAFRKAHMTPAKETPMVNMDCIGDGEYLLLAASKRFREDDRLYAALKKAFSEASALHCEAEKTAYPSDQKKFDRSLAIAALRKGPRVGYYMNRIHTPKDTVLKEENVARVTDGLCAMAEEYLR